MMTRKAWEDWMADEMGHEMQDSVNRQKFLLNVINMRFHAYTMVACLHNLRAIALRIEDKDWIIR